jgi:2-(3-amino-3-carboxypropyl)histidine synthase
MKQPRILYIESKQKNSDINLDKAEISKLPKKLFLAYSIQYKLLAESIREQLKKEGIKTEGFQQVLGCSKIKTNFPVLLVSTGKFHAQNLFLQTPILYILENNKIAQISEKDIKAQIIRKKTALLKFLKSEKIGILVSTKPGQEKLNKAIKLKAILEKKGKQAYIFVSNNINTNQFENFSIDSWVNTACPGLCMDNSSIINIEDIPE